jgi:hypothetical protein
MTAVIGQQGLDRGDEAPGAGRRDWDQRLARRTHALGGSEITAILSLAGATDVITFSGGFPEPALLPVLAGRCGHRRDSPSRWKLTLDIGILQL